MSECVRYLYWRVIIGIVNHFVDYLDYLHTQYIRDGGYLGQNMPMYLSE